VLITRPFFLLQESCLPQHKTFSLCYRCFEGPYIRNLCHPRKWTTSWNFYSECLIPLFDLMEKQGDGGRLTSFMWFRQC